MLITMDICLIIASAPARVQLASLDPLDFQAKRVLVVFEETLDHPENKASGDQQAHPAAQETKETLEKTDPQ